MGGNQTRLSFSRNSCLEGEAAVPQRANTAALHSRGALDNAREQFSWMVSGFKPHRLFRYVLHFLSSARFCVFSLHVGVRLVRTSTLSRVPRHRFCHVLAWLESSKACNRGNDTCRLVRASWALSRELCNTSTKSKFLGRALRCVYPLRCVRCLS